MIEPATNPISIEELSRRLYGPLRRYFEKRIGRSDEVEDLIQEVFVRLADGKLDSVRGADAYLFRTAANLLRDRHRRRLARSMQAHEPFEDAIHSGAAPAPSPERHLLGQEAVERLIAALYAMPERTRNVWVLYHFEDLTHLEISKRLGMAQSTVEKHMSRANTHLLTYVARFTPGGVHGS